MNFPDIHRVVTGHDAKGRAIVAIDGRLPSVRELQALPGMVFHEVWETDETPARVDNGDDPTVGPVLHQAPKNGTRIRFVDFPPDAEHQLQAEQMTALFAEVNGSANLTADGRSPHPMMHRSESVDYGVVIEGEVTLILDASEVSLRSGSVVVQRGTNHAWSNRSAKPCRMLFIQIDGRYDAALASLLAPR